LARRCYVFDRDRWNSRRRLDQRLTEISRRHGGDAFAVLADRGDLRQMVEKRGFVHSALYLVRNDDQVTITAVSDEHGHPTKETGAFLLILNRTQDGISDPMFPSRVANWAYKTKQAEVLMYDPEMPSMSIIRIDLSDPMPLAEVDEDVSDMAAVAAEYFGKFVRS
jgi:hypothetical protein